MVLVRRGGTSPGSSLLAELLAEDAESRHRRLCGRDEFLSAVPRRLRRWQSFSGESRLACENLLQRSFKPADHLGCRVEPRLEGPELFEVPAAMMQSFPASEYLHFQFRRRPALLVGVPFELFPFVSIPNSQQPAHCRLVQGRLIAAETLQIRIRVEEREAAPQQQFLARDSLLLGS